MKLWLLDRITDKFGRLPAAFGDGYDQDGPAIVRAESAEAARLLMHKRWLGVTWRPGLADAWLDELQVSCVELTAEGPAEIILTDPNAS